MKYYKLFTSCKVVDGYKRSAIYDLQKGTMYFIPKQLSKHIKSNIFSIELLKSKIPKEHYRILLDLKNREYFISFDNKNAFKRFPDIGLGFDEPGKITNSIIYINETSDAILTISKLVDFGCYYFHLVFTCEDYLTILESVLKKQ